MPCPFFDPAAPLEPGTWPSAMRWPLVDAWRGTCQLDRRELDTGTLLGCCNRGYVRGVCDRAPEDAPDAVRFSMLPDGEVHFAMERDHAPVLHGLARMAESEVLRRQAEAFARSWEARTRTR
jgi:hypothetical protein